MRKESLKKELKKQQKIIDELTEELIASNKGMIALTLELEQTQENYQNIFKNSILGIYQSTGGNRYKIANPNMAKILGYDTPNELIKSIYNIDSQIYGDSNNRDNFKKLIKKNGFVSDFESKIYDKDGNKKWILENTRLLKNQEGQFIGYEGIVQDITVKKKMERKVILFNNRLEILNKIIKLGNDAENLNYFSEKLVDIVLNLMNITGGALYLNDEEERVANIFYHKGLPSEFIETVKCISYDSMPYRIVLVEGNAIFTENNKEFEPELSKKWKNSALAIIPITTAGKIIGALNVINSENHTFTKEERTILQAIGKEVGSVILRLIMEEGLEILIEKRTKELKESEEKYRFLLENLPVGIVVHDADTSVISCNKKAEELLELTYDQMVGKKTIDKEWNFIKEDHTIIPQEEYPANLILSSKKPLKDYIGGIVSPKNDYVKWILVNGYSNIDEKGVIKNIVTTNIDITKLKNIEQELKILMEDLKRSNAELEQFAYVASHDLQEPLRMVASFTQLLQRRYKDKLDNDANDFINYAADGAIRMQGLINDLLLYSRVGTRGKPFKATDMNVILESVKIDLSTLITESNAEVTCDPLPVIIADDSQMTQLFQNLISNAIKFNTSEIPMVHITGEVKENSWEFSVKDNGIGIDSQYFDRIFIIFQRLHKKDEYGGTGIGLAVCKKIVQRHGGKIWVESEKDKGSTFYFSIPKKKFNSYN